MSANIAGISEQEYINEEEGNNIEPIDNNFPNSGQYDREKDLKRYSINDLISLRNDQHSINNPEYGLKSRLQSLSIWNGEMVSHPSNNQNSKMAFIDHRSMSSSHLMPAFAKRRLSMNSAHNLSEEGVLSNNGSITDSLNNDRSCNDGESLNHLDTSTSLKTPRKITQKSGVGQTEQFVWKTSEISNRSDKNDQLDKKSGWKIISDYTPPSLNNKSNSFSYNKQLNYERRIGSGRLVPRDVNLEMPVGGGNNSELDDDRNVSTSSMEDTNNSFAARYSDSRPQQRRSYERRISQSDDTNKEKHETNSSYGGSGNKRNGDERNNLDRNLGTGVENFNQRNSTPRYSDSRPQQRRSYERRISQSDDTYNEKHEITSSYGGSGNKRYSKNHGNDRNHLDQNNSNHFQQTPQQFVGQRSMTFHRREYSEPHSELGDYRDFRQQRDFRDHRSSREQKAHKQHRDEPEWFSEGPTSQHDTIELRGFEEINDDKEVDMIKNERKPADSDSLNDADLSVNENSNSDNSFLEQLTNNINKNLLEEVENDDEKQNQEIIDDRVENDADLVKINNEKIENMEKRESTDLTELFLDNFLNMESIEDCLFADQDPLLTANDCGGGTSRFSQWFMNKSNNDISSNNEDSNLPIVAERESSSKDENNCSVETNSFMAFLRSNNFPAPELPKNIPQNISALSVEELEARMRKRDNIERLTRDVPSHATDIPSQDVEAFKKLLDQMGKPQGDISNIMLPPMGHPIHFATPVGVLPSNTLSQSNMLKHEEMLRIMHQQQQQQHHHHRLLQLSPHHHQQQQQQGGVIENMPTMAVPPHLSHPQQRLDVLHLQQSLARGEVTLNRVEHELNKLNIPTQRELQMHTQAVMQHEAMRRRQEEHKQLELEPSNQQTQQPVIRHINSSTPLAFMPTSVLRKMTAEKDSSQQISTAKTSPQLNQPQQIHNQQLINQHANQQPRIILGGRSHHQHVNVEQHNLVTSNNSNTQITPQQKAHRRNQQPAPVEWSSGPTHPRMNSASINKPMGRPILKGPIPALASHTQNQQQQWSNLSNNIQSSNQNAQTLTQNQTQHRQIVGQQIPQHLLSQQVNLSHQNNQQQLPQLFQQKQQQHRSTNIHPQQIQQHPNAGNHINIPSVRNTNFQRDGGLSPTSNQLAQWFSPELLAQASAGKLPLLNMNQAVSLEEFERNMQHSSTAAVHN